MKSIANSLSVYLFQKCSRYGCRYFSRIGAPRGKNRFSELFFISLASLVGPTLRDKCDNESKLSNNQITPKPKSSTAANVQKLSGDEQRKKFLYRCTSESDLAHEAIKLQLSPASV